MSKLMRRCGSFLMMLLLVIGILPMTANAETTQNTEYRREKCALCAGAGGLGEPLRLGVEQ